MQRTQTITSAANPLLREVRRAITRNDLTHDGLSIAEGFHLLDEALRSGRDVPTVLAAESAITKLGNIDTRIIAIPDALFQSIASTETPQGVIALVRPAAWTLEQIFHGTSLVVVLDALQDPGNAGAIVRAAEAFGATGAAFLKGSVSPFNPKCMRASAGSIFRLPVAALDESLLLAALEKKRAVLYAAMPRAGLLVSDANFSASCAIVIGSEARGVSQHLTDLATALRIPTTGVESLNAAVAAGILFYEARRQRTAK
jgi:TrmH family RNA methyltransferase